MTIDTATGTFEDKDVGNDKDVTVSYTLKGAGSDNYEVENYYTFATINKKPLTILPTYKNYDGKTSVTMTTDMIEGDDVTLTGTMEGKDVGTQSIVALGMMGNDANNYSITLPEPTSVYVRAYVGDSETYTLAEGTYTNLVAGVNAAEVQKGGTLTGTGVTFKDNSSTGNGGAIKMSQTMQEGGTVSLTNAIFENNTANGSGGAIVNYYGSLTIDGGTFKGNSATGSGGAINISRGQVTLTDATFENNTATTGGGAIANNDGSSMTVYGNAVFNGNSAEENGGAISNSGELTFMDSVTFKNNRITVDRNHDGGAIKNGGNLVFKKGATFENNTSPKKYGAIYSDGSSTITFAGLMDLQTDTDTWHNRTSDGACVYWDLTGVTTAADSTVRINGFQRYSNNKGDNKYQNLQVKADQAAGEYVIASGDFDMEKLTANLSTNFTVKCENAKDLAITVGDERKGNGNQLFSLAFKESAEAGADQLVLTVTDYDERIVVNTTTYPEGCTLETGKTYTAKPTNQKGGAVNISNNAYATGTNLKFIGNSVTDDYGSGGAIYSEGSLTISGTADFIGNSAGFSGAIDNRGTLTIDGDATFSGNTANSNGGAFNNCGGALTIKGNSTFSGNTANSAGGAIQNTATSTLTLASATFINNTVSGANGTGGAIQNESSTLTFTSGATFNGNSAKNGGAIYNKAGTVNFAGVIDLQTETDTWGNTGFHFSSQNYATVNWDLTGATTACINGFQRYSNLEFSYEETKEYLVKQTITVKADQATGDYTLATGDMTGYTTDATGKYTFIVKTADDSVGSDTLTVDGEVEYNGLAYKLAVDNNGTKDVATDDKLVLTVFEYDERIVVPTPEYSSPYTLTTGKTYTAKSDTSVNGGALLVNAGGEVTGTNVTFSGNSASAGGAVSVEAGGTLSLTDATFTGNSASQAGGAVYNTGVITFSGKTDFSDNVSLNNMSSGGGAIWSSGDVTFNDEATFTGNSGYQGGAILHSKGKTMTFAKSATFTGNSATCGGAINNYGGTINFNDVATFSGNSDSANYGDAICNESYGYQYSGVITFAKGATFKGNRVSKDEGDAIYNDDGAVINFAGTMDLQTTKDSWRNNANSKVNWDISGGLEQYGSITHFEQYANADSTVMQTITVKAANQAGGKYVIATGDMTGYATDETGKYSFILTGITGKDEVAITVGDIDKSYGSSKYSLAIDDDKLVLSVVSDFGVSVDEALNNKWFKAGEAVTLFGTYVSETAPSITVGDKDATVDTTEKTWSYTYKPAPSDTTGTEVTIAITDGTQSAETKYTLKVDTVAPKIKITATEGYKASGSGVTWYQKDVQAKISATATDPEPASGVAGMKRDGAAYEAGSNVDLDTSAEMAQAKTYTFGATDMAGNEGAESTFTYNVDNTPIVADKFEVKGDTTDSNIYKTANGTWVKAQTDFTVSARVTDDGSKVNSGSGVKDSSVILNDETMTRGQSDVFSHTYNKTQDSVITDWAFSAQDNVGNNYQDSDAVKIGIDGTAATLSDIKVNGEIGENGWYNFASGEVTITGKSDDTLSGVKNVEYTIDGQNWSNADGTTTWTLTAGASATVAGDVYSFRATDNVGNVSTEEYKTEAFKIDQIGPSAVITVNPTNPDGTNDWYKTTPTYTVVAKDNLSGVWKIDYSTDGNTWQNLYTDSDVTTAETSVTRTLDVDDTTGMTYQFRVTDVAGNVYNVSEQSIKVDTILPTIEVTHDPAFYTDEVTVTAKFDDKGSGIATQQYKINDGKWQNYTADFTVDYNCTITFKAVDKAGNERYTTHIVDNIDIVAPIITIDADTETVMEEVAFSVTAEDVNYTTITKLEYSTDDGKTWTDLQVTPAKSVTADLTATVNNTTYIFRATDKAKNVSEESVTFNNIYKGTEESYEIIGIMEVTPDLPVDTETLVMNGDAMLLNNGSVTADTLKVTGTDNVVSGNLIEVDEIELAEGAELDVSKEQYDSFMAGTEFTSDNGKLNVAYSTGNALRPQDVDTLMGKENIASIAFEQNMIDINKLNVKNTKETTISFEDAYGTSNNDTIRFYQGTNVTFGAAGREINLEEGSNTVQIDKNADIDILSNLTNVSTLKSASGSTVKLANIDFQLGRNAALKAEGLSFTAGNVNGTDKITSITTAKSTGFTAGDIALGDKSDKISNGKYAAFTANSISSADTISFGAYSETEVGNIEGTKKLTVSSGSSKNGGATFVAKAVTGTDANDSFNFGSYNDAELTSLDFGDGNDTLTLGTSSKVDIKGLLDFGDGTKDKLSIGKNSVLSVSELDVASLDTLSMGKGSYFVIADADDLADAKYKWSKYAEQIVSKLA